MVYMDRKSTMPLLAYVLLIFLSDSLVHCQNGQNELDQFDPCDVGQIFGWLGEIEQCLEDKLELSNTVEIIATKKISSNILSCMKEKRLSGCHQESWQLFRLAAEHLIDIMKNHAEKYLSVNKKALQWLNTRKCIHRLKTRWLMACFPSIYQYASQERFLHPIRHKEISQCLERIFLFCPGRVKSHVYSFATSALREVPLEFLRGNLYSKVFNITRYSQKVYCDKSKISNWVEEISKCLKDMFSSLDKRIAAKRNKPVERVLNGVLICMHKHEKNFCRISVEESFEIAVRSFTALIHRTAEEFLRMNRVMISPDVEDCVKRINTYGVWPCVAVLSNVATSWNLVEDNDLHPKINFGEEVQHCLNRQFIPCSKMAKEKLEHIILYFVDDNLGHLFLDRNTQEIRRPHKYPGIYLESEQNSTFYKICTKNNIIVWTKHIKECMDDEMRNLQDNSQYKDGREILTRIMTSTPISTTSVIFPHLNYFIPNLGEL